MYKKVILFNRVGDYLYIYRSINKKYWIFTSTIYINKRCIEKLTYV